MALARGVQVEVAAPNKYPPWRDDGVSKAESTLSGLSFEWTCNLVVNMDGFSSMLFVCKLKDSGSLVEGWRVSSVNGMSRPKVCQHSHFHAPMMVSINPTHQVLTLLET